MNRWRFWGKKSVFVESTMLFDTALLQEVRKTTDTKGVIAGLKKFFRIFCLPCVFAKGSFPNKGPTLIMKKYQEIVF